MSSEAMFHCYFPLIDFGNAFDLDKTLNFNFQPPLSFHRSFKHKLVPETQDGQNSIVRHKNETDRLLSSHSDDILV